ncbi:MAG: hypothetical protein QOF76_1754 [Solirubrobacteraceae bacterium]|nr:hypothetical protein [Solirubrobacteraceae bacterium]
MAKSLPSRIKHRLTGFVRPSSGGTNLADIAGGLTLPRGWNDAALLHEVEAELAGSNPPVVVAIARGRAGAVGRLLATRFPAAEVHVLVTGPAAVGGLARTRAAGAATIHPAPGVPAMHTALVGVGPVAVLIDPSPGASTRQLNREAFEELVYHLEDGGRYLLAGGRAAAGTALHRELADLAARREPRPTSPAPLVSGKRPPVPDDPVRARAVREVRDGSSLTVVVKAGRQAMKLRDAEAEPAMTARRGETWGRRLDTRAPVTFAARATLVANEQRDTFRRTIEIPELYLREYRDVGCAPRGLVVQEDLILPISFHHGYKRRLEQASRFVWHGGRYFAEVSDTLREAPVLPGTYYHLDSEYPGHFGHVIGEDLSKLWGWPAAKAAHPELKVLLSSRRAGEGPKGFQLALLRALDIADEDVTCIDAPVRVERLIGASQMFYNGRYAHPDLVAIWDRLRDALRPERPASDLPRRLFVDRPLDGLRQCRNGAQVRDLFGEHGFHVVRPEELDMAAQVELFAGAEVVAGFAGSGLFNTIYAERPVRLIVIGSSSYRARNEWTISATKGGEYHHFFGPAELTEELLRSKGRGFQAPFAFDFARDGAALRALLAE